jgi:integrase
MDDLIDAHLSWARAAGMSGRTVKEKARVLTVADAELPLGLESAVHTEITAWLDKPRWSQSTRCIYHCHLHGFYRWAVAGELLDIDPMVAVRRPRTPRRLPRPVTAEILAKILTEAEDPYRTFALLAAAAGLRCCEISGLWREDITDQVIEIRRA